MNIFDLSPREFNDFLLEEAQYRSAEEIDDLRRRYREQNSLAGMIRRGLTAEEGRRRSTFLPIDAPQGMSIWDAITSGEAGISLPQGLVDMLAGGVRAVESPAEYAMGIPPRADALGDAFNVAGTAMLGGGAVARPAGSLGSNSVREVVKKYPDVEIDIYGNPQRGYELGKIKVPEGQRGSGLGTQVMDEIVAAADAEGARVSLTPDTSFGGTSVSRLKDFYKRFGFVENKGKNKDFSTRNTMYRDPLMANASKSAGALTFAADVAERGDTILNMLKSGQADNITDAMLDMGDSVKNTQLNQYLFQNYDLPMDEASRMARAQEMGLLDDAYHATDAEFQQFIPSQVGRHGAGVYTGKNAPDVQTFLPKDEETRRYAEGSKVLPLRIPDDAQMASEIKWQDALPERWNYGDPKDVTDAISGYAEAADTLSQAGFKGVVQPATDWDGRVIFDPTNIRSRFARFDPRLSHLSNLTAANMSPLGGLVAQGMVSQEELEDYLRQKGL